MSSAPDTHQREPESLAREIWFYSLERRAQSTLLRRVATVFSVAAVIFLVVAMAKLAAAAGAIALVAAVFVLEFGAYVRGTRQKRSVLAQLQSGANTQTVDAVGQSLPNRTLIVLAVVVAAVVASIVLLVLVVIA